MQPACARMPRRVQRDPFVGRRSGCHCAAMENGRWKLVVLDGTPRKPSSRADVESCWLVHVHYVHICCVHNGSRSIDWRSVLLERFFMSSSFRLHLNLHI